MNDPTLNGGPDSDAEVIEKSLRDSLEPPCSTHRVWQRLSATLPQAGTDSALSQESPPSMRRRSPRWWRAAAMGLAAAALVGIVLLLARQERIQPRPSPENAQASTYPAPVAAGSYIVPDGGPVRRDSELVTLDRGAMLSLGGYCWLDIQPETYVLVAGAPRAETLVLRAGEVFCNVDRGVGSFEIHTDVGNVAVHGTTFRTRFRPAAPGYSVLQATLTVSVDSGAVEVNGRWGSTLVKSGETRTFTQAGELPFEPVPSKAPRLAADWPLN